MAHELEDRERVARNLRYHKVTDDQVMMKMEQTRSAAESFAYVVIDNTPHGRERAMALTAIEDATMYSIAGLAREQ